MCVYIYICYIQILHIYIYIYKNEEPGRNGTRRCQQLPFYYRIMLSEMHMTRMTTTMPIELQYPHNTYF